MKSVSLALAASVLVVTGGPAGADGYSCPAFAAVEGGSAHTLAVTPGGAVWAWGGGGFGQLGDGASTDRPNPVQVPGLTGVTAVAAGRYHSLALTASGAVWAWGSNAKGQLGDGTTTGRSTPVQVPGLTGMTAIAAGTEHSLAVGPGGAVAAWGWNFHGQLGDGTTTDRHLPVQVSGLTGATKVAAGFTHSLALGGAVFAWGGNSSGQLGDGTESDRHLPVTVSGLGGTTAIAAGADHSLAIGAVGVVKAWGANGDGQLGDGTTADRSTPVTVSGLSGTTAIAAGNAHSLALGSGGSVLAWGSNSDGQLGDGTLATHTTPVTVSGTTGTSGVAAGSYHSLAAGSAGTVAAWGDGFWGQLGNGGGGQLTPGPIWCLPATPSATFVTDAPDPVAVGGSVSFTLGWTDPNPGDEVRAVICRTDAVSAGTCPGGAWAVGTPSTTSPSTATYTTTAGDIGARSYFAFGCDSTDRCSLSQSGTFTVLPSPSAVGPETTRGCGLVAATDTATGLQVGLMNGGPFGDPSQPTAGTSLTCTIQVGSGGATHAGADAVSASSSEGTGLAVLPARSVSYAAPSPGDVYLCSESSVGGTTYYWDAGAGVWSTSDLVACNRAVVVAQLPPTARDTRAASDHTWIVCAGTETETVCM